MRQLARATSLPRGVTLVLLLVAAAALWAIPARATPTTAKPACPDGLARVASWEPVQVADGMATVAFVLAPGCREVDMSLVSYQVRSGRGLPPMVLHAATGHFSAGKVNRLTALVGSDCAFRVVFAVGRPEAAGQPGAAVEATMQAPDPCMYGAAPVVVTGSTTTTGAPTTTAPPTTTTAGLPVGAGAKAPKRPVAAVRPDAGPSRAEPGARTGASGPARAVQTTTPARTATTEPEPPATSIPGLASEPVSAIGVGPSGPLAGWDAASLLGLAVLALGIGLALLWLTHSRGQRGRASQR
jgi:hypothetical protein